MIGLTPDITQASVPRHGFLALKFADALSTETVALSWTVLLAFIRLSTRPVVVEQPLSASRDTMISLCYDSGVR